MDKNNFLKEDIERIFKEHTELEALRGTTVLVTGATGLLGSMTVRTLSSYFAGEKAAIKILALVRSEEKAHAMLADLLKNNNIEFVEQDIVSQLHIDGAVDHIIHTASPTKSKFFVTMPVETSRTIVQGMINVLELAREKQSRSVVYLSSMEVYGEVTHEELLKISDLGFVDPLSLRSSYPEGKRMAENLCAGYYSEYGVPVKIIRLAQTFGPGIPKEDNRVFAQFIHSVLADEDIVMFTNGGSKHMYLDTMDAVSAVLVALIKGKSGEAYNAANESTYCSIKEMAELVIERFGSGKSKLVIDLSKNNGQFPPEHKLRLDVTELRSCGWVPHYDLANMYERMLKYAAEHD